MLKILVSNDDGVHAEGIQTLIASLKSFADVYVVAPLEERSTTGHALSLNNPLRVVEIERNIWGCSGYPADCIFMGVGHLARDVKFDVVVSGINRGANLGQDVYYSGTVAAAREGAFRKIPAIAISTVTDHLTIGDPIHYQSAAKYLRNFLSQGGHKFCPPLGVVNINVPNLPYDKIKVGQYSRLGFRIYTEDIEERLDCRDRPYYWIGGQYRGPDRDDGTDCMTIENNNIAITLLNLLGQSDFDCSAMEAFVKKLVM